MYCGPLLININPGPNYINDYLNLQSWLNETRNVNENRWKPHLYSFGHYVYQTMMAEGKDQAINMLGGIGSGKTFNLIHLMEYFCYTGAHEQYQAETFETIHKSIQLVHILGSILRQNNLESTSCGMLIRLGFNDNGKICNFDLESKILDFTLPFSQNGRSFSILHSLMTGASPTIKKMLELPENDSQLNFFKKFTQNFDEKLKEKFKLNDLEIWTRFHSLLKFFQFDKNEVLEILQLFSFILLCNEAAIGKKKGGKNQEEFSIKKGHSSRKLSKMLNMNEDEFLTKFSNYKDLNEVKNTLISLMKYTYYIIFEYCKNKVKTYSQRFFDSINESLNKQTQQEVKIIKTSESNKSVQNNIKTDQTFSNKTRWINLLDFPGSVQDSTLGGLSTNLANECLNVYAGTQYLSVVDKLLEEKTNLRYFDHTHSYFMMKSLIGRSGIFNYLSQPFTEENFRSLQRKVKITSHFKRTTEFNENTNDGSEFLFNLKFSHLNVDYNYEALYMETKSLIQSNKITSIFGSSKNTIIKSTFKNIVSNDNKKILNIMLTNLKELFKPLEGISPFVIYCLHSNNSLKIFFGDKYLEHRENWVIPLNLTIDSLRNSLTIPVLYWEWFGYHEWVEINKFIKEFGSDFEKIKENILKQKNKYQKQNPSSNKLPPAYAAASLSELNPYDMATYILSVLGNNSQYILGSKHVILKKGTLKELRKLVDRMLNIAEKKESFPQKRGTTPITNSIVKEIRKTSGRASSLTRPTNSDLNSNIINYQNPSQKNSIVNRMSAKNSLKSLVSKDSIKSINSNTSKNVINRRSSADSKLPSQKILENNENNAYSSNGSNNTLNKLEKVNKNLPLRRASMKVQCHLNLIEDIKMVANHTTSTNLTIESFNLNKINEEKNPHGNNNVQGASNYKKSPLLLFKLLNKQQHGGSDSSFDEDYQNDDYLPSTENEKNFEKYQKENNIVVPKNIHFNDFKSLLNYSQKSFTHFEIFDYKDYTSDIVKIQNSFRAYRARKRYKIFRYIIRKIINVQKFIRGIVIRKKFKKFKYFNKCITFIQRLYKKRFDRRYKAVVKIQSAWRSKKGYEIGMEKKRNYYMQDLEENKIFENVPYEAELLNISVKSDLHKLSSFVKKTVNSSILSLEDLGKEKDKDKIINHLLMEELGRNRDPNLNSIRYDKSGISNKLRMTVREQQMGTSRRKSQNKVGLF
jgi:hypothetical protein